jgi:hypothetical protein
MRGRHTTACVCGNPSPVSISHPRIQPPSPRRFPAEETLQEPYRNEAHGAYSGPWPQAIEGCSDFDVLTAAK